MSALTIRVHGTPAPQGSKRHVGGGRMVEMSKNVKPWREAVKHAALGEMANTWFDEYDGRWPMARGPIDIEVLFHVVRPKGHYRTGRNAGLLRDAAPSRPTGTPDIDKLLRSTFDALTDAGVWADDSLVVGIHATKAYADTAGAILTIRAGAA